MKHKHCFPDLPTNLFFFFVHFLTTLYPTYLHTDEQNSSYNTIHKHLSNLRLLSGIQQQQKKDNYFISNGLTTYPFHFILRDLDLFTETVEYLAELTVFACFM